MAKSRISSAVRWACLFVLAFPFVRYEFVLTNYGAAKSQGLRHRFTQLHSTDSKYESVTSRQPQQNGNELPTASRGVVILPGPHKTGSSSVQLNMVMWTRSGTLSGWTWPQITPVPHGKNYMQLVNQLRTGEMGVKSIYGQLFQDAWEEGENIVFGAELMDTVTMDPENRIVDGLISMMPWNQNPSLYGSNELITVSVTYRSPRAEHLISVWHQIGTEGVSLSEFILNLEDDSRQWHASLNPLGVADAFARKGLSTVIIDSIGLRSENLDLSMVVACEVLHASCRNNTIVGLNEAPLVKNVKFGRGEMDLDEVTLQEVGKVLELMDASYCHLEHQFNVKVLHRQNVFSFCEDGTLEKGPIDSKEAVRRIKAIVFASMQSGA